MNKYYTYLFIIPIEEYLKNSAVPRIEKQLEKKIPIEFCTNIRTLPTKPYRIPKKEKEIPGTPFKTFQISFNLRWGDGGGGG